MRHFAAAALCVALCGALGRAQTSTVYTIETVVGGAVYNNLPGTVTPLSFPQGLYLDRDGGLWIADSGNQVIRRLDLATGALRVVIGGGDVIEDGVPVAGVTVRLERPSHLVGDAAGNIYFTDSAQHRVRKWTPDGQVSTIAGTGEAGPAGAGDGGPARLARLNGPTGIALDTAGNLYIAEANTCRVRRVNPAGTITTFAGGTGRCGYFGDGGPALAAGFDSSMQGLAFSFRGHLYIATNAAIRWIEAGTGIIRTAVGTGSPNCSQIPDGTAAPARGFCAASNMVFDGENNLYFTYNFGVARVAAATGLVTHIAGTFLDTGLARDSAGNLFYAGSLAGVVRRVPPPGGGPQTDIAGTEEAFDGPGQLAVLVTPHGVASDSAGVIYIAERRGRRVRRFDSATGRVSTVAGGGSTPSADGVAATAARFNDIHYVTVDAQGNIYFSEIGVLWKADGRTRLLTRLASSLNSSLHGGDGGPAIRATFGGISGVATDAAGNIYFADSANHRVRRIEAATSIINTVAGNGNPGTTGDGGLATAAAVQNPGTLAFDRQGQLLIGTNVGIRRVNLSTGIISTVQARSAASQPLSPYDAGDQVQVAVDRDGNIFTVTPASRVRQIRASDGLIIEVGGSTAGFSGDGGLATLARLNVAFGQLAVDAPGALYVADELNNRLRKLTPAVVRPEMAVSPVTLFFSQPQGSTVINAQQLTIGSANALPFNWTLEVATSAGGAWLNTSRTAGAAPATILVTVDAPRLGPGTYRGTVTVRADGVTNAPQTVEVVLTVTGAAGSVLGLSQQYLNFQAVEGGANPGALAISISNTGSGTLSWSATAETSSGGAWLRVSPGLGTAPSTLQVSAEMAGLAQGVYQGRVILRNLTGNETRTIGVVLTVTRPQPILQPSQTGFLFVGVEGSLVIGPQSFAIQNAGQGRMNWTVAANLPGGGDWLRVSPASGTSEAGQPAPQITLQVDPSRLRAGVSVALLSLTAEGAANSPQTAIVLVNMLPRGSLPVGTINPLGVIFTAQAGSTTAQAQGISIASTGGQSLQFLARTRTAAGGSWLSVTPEQGVLLSSAESANLTVQAQPRGLSAGVYFGTITLSFGTGVTQEVAVALVVAAATTPTGLEAQSATRSPQAACTPRRVVIVEKKLGSRFSLSVAWPIPLLSEVVDDCGTAVTNGSVTATFTNGDPALPFRNLLNGEYAATWVPARGGTVGVTIRAAAPSLEDGVAQFAGNIGASSTLPLLFRDSWVNAASFAGFRPLAPGMIFSLFGSNLANGSFVSGEVPLPRQLGDLKVTMGGIDVPLFYAGEGQVNAQVPFELANVRSTSIVATGRVSAGAPGNVTIVDAQPGIFTVSQSGSGQGIVVDAQHRIADSNNPVGRGEVVVIYATGLGVLEPPVPTGAAAPITVLSRVTVPVTVTIGGHAAQVDFAGAAPGFVGLYQVNARVPEAVQPGSVVPLLITQAGVSSNTVTIGVR